jgi:lysine-specific demethylase 8
MREAGIAVVPIPRARNSTVAGLRGLVATGRRPAIFAGLTDGWTAHTSWTPDELRRRYGDILVTALVGLPSDGVLLPADQRQYEREMSFTSFIDLTLAAPPSAPCYLAYKRAHELFDPREYDFGALVPADGHGSDTRVWIGSAGTRSMLHSDLKDNLFCQVSGRKSVILLSWRDSRAAYPFPNNLVNSQVDLAEPDLVRFPRLRRVTFYHAIIEPGEVLYIPRGWWHDIRACSPSVSINHWFGESQRLGEYLKLLAVSGPRHWLATGRDFIRHGALHRTEETRFFFSPPSTGRRLYDAIRFRNFSRANDPNTDG